jgi:hypothetical protein
MKRTNSTNFWFCQWIADGAMRRVETERAGRAVKEQEGDVFRFRSHNQFRGNTHESIDRNVHVCATDLLLMDRTLRGHAMTLRLRAPYSPPMSRKPSRISAADLPGTPRLTPLDEPGVASERIFPSDRHRESSYGGGMAAIQSHYWRVWPIVEQLPRFGHFQGGCISRRCRRTARVKTQSDCPLWAECRFGNIAALTAD